MADETVIVSLTPRLTTKAPTAAVVEERVSLWVRVMEVPEDAMAADCRVGAVVSGV